MDNLSEWGKEVKKALIDADMSIRDLADRVGLCDSVVSGLINGRYSNATVDDYVSRINEVLATEGKPVRTKTPHDEWSTDVKVALVKKHITVSRMANDIGETRDAVSLAINGKSRKESVIEKICKYLGVNSPEHYQMTT